MSNTVHWNNKFTFWKANYIDSFILIKICMLKTLCQPKKPS